VRGAQLETLRTEPEGALEVVVEVAVVDVLVVVVPVVVVPEVAVVPELPEPLNCHQLKLKRLPLPPVKRKKTS
jgi:hypothetical protein